MSEGTEITSEMPPSGSFDINTSDEVVRVLLIIFSVALSGTVGVTGSACNVTNIIIFLRQGFKDSVNISLCGLAISDLGTLLTTIWTSICLNPLFQYSNIDFDSAQINHLTAGWPHGCFAWITSSITAFITFERCVCIALPMKVKDIITPKRTLIIVAITFLVCIACVSPVFIFIHFGLSYDNERNRTMLILVYSSIGQEVENVAYTISVVMQFCFVVIIIVCTVVMMYNLVSKSRWRLKVTLISSSRDSDSMSLRDKRILKMATFISCAFITCYLPITVTLILMRHFSSVFNHSGKYKNIYHATWSILNTLVAVNSSINIIIYYTMSSKFRESFNELFRVRKRNC